MSLLIGRVKIKSSGWSTIVAHVRPYIRSLTCCFAAFPVIFQKKFQFIEALRNDNSADILNRLHRSIRLAAFVLHLADFLRLLNYWTHDKPREKSCEGKKLNLRAQAVMLVCAGGLRKHEAFDDQNTQQRVFQSE